MDIEYFVTDDGKAPFNTSLKRIRDARAVARILFSIDRLRVGLVGDVKSVGGGVFEIRVDEGKGYRVYFGKRGEELVLLLLVGSKAQQQKDIVMAKAYWRMWKRSSK